MTNYHNSYRAIPGLLSLVQVEGLTDAQGAELARLWVNMGHVMRRPSTLEQWQELYANVVQIMPVEGAE